MITHTRKRTILVDPTTSPTPAEFDGAPRLADLSDRRVGLIDDSKPNAKEMLEEVASALDRRYGISNVEYHRKPSASKPAEPEVIAALSRDCDYVIVGVGD